MKLHKLKPGPIREFPVFTHNELVSEVEGLRRQVTELVDHRSPKSKSPVVVQLIWVGPSFVEPGRCVKLAAAAFDPSTVESAPFSGLAFFCVPFEEGDQLDKYAITAGPLAAATLAEGTLTTRTDDDTGTLTMSGGHGIATGDTIVLQWDGGGRYSVEVGTVSGNSVPIDGGRGDVLPDAATEITVVRSAETGYGVIPEAYWAKVNLTDDTHTRAIAAAGTLLNSAATGGVPILWKPDGTGEKWCVVSVVSREDRLVGADTSDGVPRELIDKLSNAGVYNATNHQLVYGQIVPDLVGEPPDNKLRLFTDKGEGSETERFRVFELVERKYSTENAATVRWLNHDLQPNLSEVPETIFDPLLRFAGAAADYAPWSSEVPQGMRGIAELWNDRPHSISGTLTTRTDNDTGVITLETTEHGILSGNTVDVYWGLEGEHARLGMTVGTVDEDEVPIDGGTGENLPSASTPVYLVNQDAVLGDPLWKIVAMEGFAQFIKCRMYGVSNYPSPGTTFEARYSSIIEKPAGSEAANWERYPPCEAGGAVSYVEDLSMYRPVHLAPNSADAEVAGDWVYMQIADRDTDPPTYRVYQVNHPGRRVKGTVVDPGDGYVAKADSTFQIENLEEVFGGPPPDEPLTVSQTYAQGYVAGQATEAVFHEDSGTWECLPLPRKVLCSLDEDANGFMFVQASALAGAGLTVELGTGCTKTSGGNADRLKVIAPTGGEGTAIAHRIDGVEVTIDSGGEIKVKLNITPVTVYGTAGIGTSFEDTADAWNKKSITYVTGVACDDGSITYETDEDEVLIPPS